MKPAAPLLGIPTREDLLAAHQRIAPYIHETPVLTSRSFDDRVGTSVHFKGEHLQKTGAFKARGAMNAVLVYAEQARGRGFITHSSGNHGAALAWAARQIGERATIVMPTNAPKTKIEAVRSYGGSVVFCKPTQSAREATAAQVQLETGGTLVHPYNDYNIIAGQATATMELLLAYPHLEQLYVPVGGGGLLAGAALANLYFGRAEVIGCEPEVANDAYLSFTTGTWHPVQSTRTVADGLRTALGEKNLEIIKSHVSRIVLVSEEEIAEGWSYIISRMKQWIEPSAGTGPAAVFKDLPRGATGILLCGGNGDIPSILSESN